MAKDQVYHVVSQVVTNVSEKRTTLFLPSFPSALQLRVSFGLLNNLPPFFSIPRLTLVFE
jgi:hypothetical protein